MSSKLASCVLLIVGIVIWRGAFGHCHTMRYIRAALDSFPIDPDISTVLYVVWYFVSGCMLVFGSTIVWLWLRPWAGEASPPFVAFLIGTLYVTIGVGGMIHRQGDLFMGFFILLVSCSWLHPGALRSVIQSGSQPHKRSSRISSDRWRVIRCSLRAQLVERREQAIDIFFIIVEVRRDADATTARTHDEAALIQRGRQALRIIAEPEHDDARARVGLPRTDDLRAAHAQAGGETVGELEQALLNQCGADLQ